jgi:hypothetical protein|tara:strand:- start:490 stop:726 length:237 start_codon:yes stop_codon:yes gene_type:complete
MSGIRVAQYRFGGLIVNVEEYNIADKRCWELYSQDGIDISCHPGEMLDQENICRYQDFDASDLDAVPTQDTVKQWCYL